MTFRGFLIRLVYVILLTWIVGSLIDSPGWGLYYALLPVALYEMVRPRGPREAHESDPPHDT